MKTMRKMEVFCRLGEELASWEVEHFDPAEAIKMVEQEVEHYMGHRSAVLVLLTTPTPVDTTEED